MIEKIEKEMEWSKEVIKESIKEVRKDLADIAKYLESEDWVNLRLEAEGAIQRLIWVSQEADILFRLERLLLREYED